ncbi:ATP-binding protein, partial [Cupriavidus gilardii]|uniref:ATP-binding protein n=1 Tax=Cupriavidus gilardii TaxID=82541 RepID=UPI001FC94DCE
VTAFGHLLDRLGPELIRISLAFHASSSLKNTLSGVYKTGDVPYDALAEDKGVHLRLQGDASIVGDRLMLRRALSNLLSNALRYTPSGKAIVIRAREQDGGATIVVENEGEGIDPELLPSLFDRFFRADKSRARADSDSVGLGLSITQAIMAAHGGRASAESTGGLTRFILSFPRRHPPI